MNNHKPHTLTKMQKYYQSHQKLVTSPFIAHEGLVDMTLLSQVLSELDIVFNSKPILDLGCGTGLLSSYFKDKGLSYIGTDINIC